MVRKRKLTPPQSNPTDQPRFLKKDRGQVVVSVDGVDRGPVERHAKGKRMETSKTPGAVQGAIDALDFQIMAVDGRPTRVMKALTTIDLLLRNGSISEEDHESGQIFANVFEWSGRDPVVTVRFGLDTPGGLGREAFLDRQLYARQKLEAMLDCVGGANTLAGRALFNVVGRNITLDQMHAATGWHAQYWRGGVVSGLQLLTKHRTGRNVPAKTTSST